MYRFDWSFIVISFYLITLIMPHPSYAQSTREVGIFLPGAIGNFSELTQLEQRLDVHFGSVMWYQSWDPSQPLNTELARKIHDHGSVPVISWEPLHNDSVVSSLDPNYQDYIKQFAAAARNLGFPLRIRFAPEMNGEWVPWNIGPNGSQSTDAINQWRHLVDTFRAEGATNVTWYWCPNVTPGALVSDYKSFYPGDNYVDFVGLDGFNFGPQGAGGSWQSFKSIFDSSYKKMRQTTSKPILLGEIGSTEIGGNKADWISAMATDLLATFSGIQGFTWFNENKEQDWRIESSQSSAGAFTAALKRLLAAASQPNAQSKPPATPKAVPTEVATATPDTLAMPVPDVTPVTSVPSDLTLPPVAGHRNPYLAAAQSPASSWRDVGVAYALLLCLGSLGIVLDLKRRFS